MHICEYCLTLIENTVPYCPRCGAPNSQIVFRVKENKDVKNWGEYIYDLEKQEPPIEAPQYLVNFFKIFGPRLLIAPLMSNSDSHVTDKDMPIKPIEIRVSDFDKHGRNKISYRFEEYIGTNIFIACIAIMTLEKVVLCRYSLGKTVTNYTTILFSPGSFYIMPAEDGINQNKY